jgi:hypothetical protein
VVLGFFVVLMGGILVVVCLVTAARGWMTYGVRHRGPPEPPPGMTTRSGQSMMIGSDIAPANYRHVITAGFGEAGIYLRTGSIFRLFHPPLLVPWTAVSKVEQKPAIKGVYTVVECEGLARLVFFGALGDGLLAHWRARVAS